MHDRQLYAQILGLEQPWQVTDVELDTTGGEVRVEVQVDPQATLCCPECGRDCPRYDSRQRRWRHLDTCQYRTILIGDVPRIECAEHGVRQVRVPWAEPGSRFTALFESLVIDWLLQASRTAVAGRMRLTWHEVDGIMTRAVRRGLARRRKLQPTAIAVDETSFRKGHDYITVVSDEHSRVIHVADERKQQSLDSFFETLDESQINAIETVTMDMWMPFRKSVEKYLPDPESKIAYDKFHVARWINGAIDQIRRGEHRQLQAAGDNRLSRTKYHWIRNPHKMSRRRWNDFRELRESSLATARAWALKETAMGLWTYARRGWAEKGWKAWLGWAARCRLKPMIKVGQMIRKHLPGIINAAITGATNAGAESINAIIRRVKIKACGYRNRERFRDAILFHAGGLDLKPAALTHTKA